MAAVEEALVNSSGEEGVVKATSNVAWNFSRLLSWERERESIKMSMAFGK